MTEFRIDTQGADIAIIRGSGNLNMVSAPDLRRAVASAVEQGRPRIVVDLGEIHFLDSSGLGALIGSLKTARAGGGDLRIARPGEQVTLVLKLSNIDRILKAYDNAETAFDD